MIMVHGRGATAESILTLTPELDRDDFAYLAPQAAYNTWYPNSFMAPIPGNQPGIDSGLARLAELVERCLAAGIAKEQIMLLGLFAGGLPGHRVCGAPCGALRRRGRAERRADRATRHYLGI
jgi:phospholipase/carboxylesterase